MVGPCRAGCLGVCGRVQSLRLLQPRARTLRPALFGVPRESRVRGDGAGSVGPLQRTERNHDGPRASTVLDRSRRRSSGVRYRGRQAVRVRLPHRQSRGARSAFRRGDNSMKPSRPGVTWVVGLAMSSVTISGRAQSEPPPGVADSHPAPSVRMLAGASREIDHAHSASRDTGAMALTLTPYSVLTAGADVAILKWTLSRVSLRVGFFGLIELESDRPFDGHTPDFIPRV